MYGFGGCVGRDRELDELAALVTSRSDAAVIAVVGAPGIGKTTLLQALHQRCGGGWARAAAWEEDLPGGVLAQLFQDEMPADPVVAAAHLVDHVRAANLGLLIVDDAEHADQVSLQAISTTVRHQRDLPVLVVLAAPSLADLPPDIASRHIVLTGLPPSAVAELARQRHVTMHPAMAEALTAHTAGSPRDVLALLTEVPAAAWSRPHAALPAPAYVVDEVRRRLEFCAPAGRAWSRRWPCSTTMRRWPRRRHWRGWTTRWAPSTPPRRRG